MEAAALCSGLVMIELMLLVAQIHGEERPSGLIVPSSLQLFEYSSLSINCEGFDNSTGWSVMRNQDGEVTECVTTWVMKAESACALKPIYLTDSGEYWCESGGERSNTVNITVTAGAVVLESPVRPVREGDAVTLHCKSKMASSSHITDFYKDDRAVSSSSSGEMKISRASRSDEGFYRCSIRDLGESAQSWLPVTASVGPPLSPLSPLSPPAPQASSCHVYLVLRTVFTVVMVALLLLVVRLLQRRNLRDTKT